MFIISLGELIYWVVWCFYLHIFLFRLFRFVARASGDGGAVAVAVMSVHLIYNSVNSLLAVRLICAACELMIFIRLTDKHINKTRKIEKPARLHDDVKALKRFLKHCLFQNTNSPSFSMAFELKS